MADSSNHLAQSNQADTTWPELLALALVLTIAAHAVPAWLFRWLPTGVLRGRFTYDVLALLFAALLAIPTPRRSGICLGRFARHRWPVLAIMAVPILLTAIILPPPANPPLHGHVSVHVGHQPLGPGSFIYRLPLRPFSTPGRPPPGPPRAD